MISFCIQGEPASKANSRKIVKFGNRPACIKSDKARNYEKSALLQVPNSAKLMIEEDIALTIKIYYASWRPDLDASLIEDVLQAKFEGKGKDRVCVRKGIYLNDRQIKEKHYYHAIDKKNPRAEITVSVISKEDM